MYPHILNEIRSMLVKPLTLITPNRSHTVHVAALPEMQRHATNAARAPWEFLLDHIRGIYTSACDVRCPASPCGPRTSLPWHRWHQLVCSQLNCAQPKELGHQESLLDHITGIISQQLGLSEVSPNQRSRWKLAFSPLKHYNLCLCNAATIRYSLLNLDTCIFVARTISFFHHTAGSVTVLAVLSQ